MPVQALRDPLTGCWNRAGLARYSSLFARNGAAAIAIDIDQFKQLNDRLGHAAGDTALVNLAEAAMEIARPLRGEVARLGGDEFAVLLPQASELVAHQYAADLKAKLPAKSIGHSWAISVGFAMTASGNSDCSQALEQADGSLYRAKRRDLERALRSLSVIQFS